MKKIIILFLFIVFPFVVLASNLGDVDNDGKVGSSDYVLLRKHLLKANLLSSDQLLRADVNHDNNITSADYILIRKIILGEEVLIQTPTPTATPTVAPTATPTPKPTATPTPKPTATPAPKVLVDSYVVPSGFSAIDDKSYYSDTLKYKIIRKNNTNNYYALIWVKDAYNQINSANNNHGGGRRLDVLNKEVASMNYNSGHVRGIIATAGSFKWNGRSHTPIIVTKGTYYTNPNYKTKAGSTYLGYSTLTVGSDGYLKSEHVLDYDSATRWLNSVGARNSWAITHFETSDWNSRADDGADWRTSICQIDKNNFVLYIGRSEGIHIYMNELHNMFGCITVVNLDGGGSAGMYYKTNELEKAQTVYEYRRSSECCEAKCGNNCRTVADMLYFVEQ